MARKKLFKIVFIERNNTYEFWWTDHTGKFGLDKTYVTLTREGNEICDKYDDVAFINENIIWEINHFIKCGYKFVGIEFVGIEN